MEILPFFAVNTYSVVLICTGDRGKPSKPTHRGKKCYAEEQRAVFEVLGILSEQQKKYYELVRPLVY